MSNTNRTKGHKAETYYAKIFREIGYDKCVTSRYGSRQHDDCAIDLINLPINVQVKAGKQRGMNPGLILREMDRRMKEAFPEDAKEHNQPNIVIHKKEPGRGNRRDKYDEIVTMSFEDYLELIK